MPYYAWVNILLLNTKNERNFTKRNLVPVKLRSFTYFFIDKYYLFGLISSFTGRIIFSGFKIVSKSFLESISCSNTSSYTPLPVSRASLAIFVEFL